MKKPEPEELEDSSGSFIMCFMVNHLNNFLQLNALSERRIEHE